ncbi:hypothetical protein CR513_56168, partial [Mucuna pruriens]
MLAHTMWLIAKTDPLKYIFEKPALTGRIERFQMALSEYDIIYTSQKLAHHPLSDHQPLQHEFLDEHIMTMEKAGSEPDSDE